MPLLLFLFLLLAACHASPAPSASSPSARPLPAPNAIIGQWSGLHGGTETPAQRLVRSRDTWETLWRQIGHDEPLSFDPAQHQAVALFLGQRPTAGYSLEIIAVHDENSGRVVDYRETRPARNRHVAQMLTSPWAIAVIPTSDRPVIFREASPDAP